MQRLNINGLTQEEIEKTFSQDEVRELLKEEYANFYAQFPQEYNKPMHEILGTKNPEMVEDTFHFILSIIGNKELGVYNEETGLRDIVAHNVISALARCKSVVNCAKQNHYLACEMAMDIVAYYDTILWDMYKKPVKNHDEQWVTITYCSVGVEFGRDAVLLSEFTKNKLPMICKPKDWIEGLDGGGYLFNTSKATTHKGAKEIPQSCLEVLNILQSNAFKLVDFIDPQHEFKTILDKQREDKTESYAQYTARNICKTTLDSYSAFKDKEFYFAWKFGANGRAYPTGYDIALHGTKHKKGFIQANFK